MGVGEGSPRLAGQRVIGRRRPALPSVRGRALRSLPLNSGASFDVGLLCLTFTATSFTGSVRLDLFSVSSQTGSQRFLSFSLVILLHPVGSLFSSSSLFTLFWSPCRVPFAMQRFCQKHPTASRRTRRLDHLDVFARMVAPPQTRSTEHHRQRGAHLPPLPPCRAMQPAGSRTRSKKARMERRAAMHSDGALHLAALAAPACGETEDAGWTPTECQTGPFGNAAPSSGMRPPDHSVPSEKRHAGGAASVPPIAGRAALARCPCARRVRHALRVGTHVHLVHPVWYPARRPWRPPSRSTCGRCRGGCLRSNPFAFHVAQGPRLCQV